MRYVLGWMMLCHKYHQQARLALSYLHNEWDNCSRQIVGNKITERMARVLFYLETESLHARVRAGRRRVG